MSTVTGLARLAGRIVPSVHMGNFSSVTEMDKTRPFKFHPGNCRAGMFIWKFLAGLLRSRSQTPRSRLRG